MSDLVITCSSLHLTCLTCLSWCHILVDYIQFSALVKSVYEYVDGVFMTFVCPQWVQVLFDLWLLVIVLFEFGVLCSFIGRWLVTRSSRATIYVHLNFLSLGDVIHNV